MLSPVKMALCSSKQGCVTPLRKCHSTADPSALLDATGSMKRRAIFEVQTEILKVMTNELLDRGFTWILPVMLAKSTDPLWPDSSAGVEKKIEVDIYGQKVTAMQSMMIQKRVLASLGPERFFILSPNIRIERRERAKTGWHLYEFTQLEVEIAHGNVKEVFKLYEDLVTRSMITVGERLQRPLRLLGRDIRVPETPFRVYKRRELQEKYGKNWEERASEKLANPIWVTDLPREFYDYEDETARVWRNFDLVLPDGYGEVISGGEREYEYARILEKLERDGLKRGEYELLLRLAKDGRLKPSAGAGLGIERFVGYVCGVEHIAEVQPFPRVPGIVPEV